MSLDVFNPAAADQNVAANAATDLPAGFSEAFDVAQRGISEFGRVQSYTLARSRALADYNDDIFQKTGERLPSIGFGDGDVSVDDFNAAQAKLQDKYPGLDYLTPLSDSSIDAMTVKRMARAHQDSVAFANRETTWGGTAGTIAGTLIGGLTDPISTATMPLGGAGEAGIALRALEFAAISGGSEAASLGLGSQSREAAAPGSSREIPGEILGAAAGGVVLGGAFGLLHQVLGLGAKPLPTSVRDDVNAASSEFQFNATNPFPTAAGDAAARDATVDAALSMVRDLPVRSGDNFDIAHVQHLAGAVEAETPEDLATFGERYLRPETSGEKPDVQAFDRMPGENETAEDYWDKRLEGATPEERSALGATDGAERISSAAIRYQGKTYEGALHADAYEAAAQDTGKPFGEVIAKTKPQDSGFVTSSGRFVDREEAAKIANDAGQTTHAVDDLAAENLPDGYFDESRSGAIAPTDLTQEQVANLAAEPATQDATLHNLDHLVQANPDMEFTTQVRQPDGSYQFVTRKLSDVMGEIDGWEQAAKEIEACAVGGALEAAE